MALQVHVEHPWLPPQHSPKSLKSCRPFASSFKLTLGATSRAVPSNRVPPAQAVQETGQPELLEHAYSNCLA